MACWQVAAGSMVNLETATSLLQESQKQKQLAVSIVVLPFKFEGQKCRKEVSNSTNFFLQKSH